MGRKVGQLVRCTCTKCGSVEMRSGCTNGFRCIECGPNPASCTLRYRAHRAVSIAVKAGVLPRVSSQSCVDCGAVAEHYDHRNYGRPLDVQPVCRKCNYRRGPAIGSRSLPA